MGIFDRFRKGAGKPGEKSNTGKFVERMMTDPPARNTVEWLSAYGTNPRLAPVGKIAQDLSVAPGKLLAIQRSGNEKELTQHPFLDFWKNPNPLPEMSAAAIWKLMEIYRGLKGEAYGILERDARGMPRELWPIPPHWVAEIPHQGSPWYVIQSREGKRMNVPIEDVFVLRDLNPLDPYGRGLGYMEAVADEVESYEYASKFAKRIFYNNARADYFIAAPGITEDQSKRFLESIEARHKGVNNAYRPGIIPRGDVAIHRLSDSPREMDFVESRKDIRDTVNAHINVPPEMLGIVENSNRATAEAAKAIYAENVLTPILLARQDAINRQLVPQFGDNLIWRYDDIIPEDQEHKLKVSNDGVANAALLLNEWRVQNGYERDPNCDVRLVGGMLVAYGKDEQLTSVERQPAGGNTDDIVEIGE
jgi:HK97 family phage portal protein